MMYKLMVQSPVQTPGSKFYTIPSLFTVAEQHTHLGFCSVVIPEQYLIHLHYKYAFTGSILLYTVPSCLPCSCLLYSCLLCIPKTHSIDTCTSIAYPTHSSQVNHATLNTFNVYDTRQMLTASLGRACMNAMIECNA